MLSLFTSCLVLPIYMVHKEIETDTELKSNEIETESSSELNKLVKVVRQKITKIVMG